LTTLMPCSCFIGYPPTSSPRSPSRNHPRVRLTPVFSEFCQSPYLNPPRDHLEPNCCSTETQDEYGSRGLRFTLSPLLFQPHSLWFYILKLHGPLFPVFGHSLFVSPFFGHLPLVPPYFSHNPLPLRISPVALIFAT